MIEEFSEEVYLALLEFEKFRKKIRKPLTERAFELLLNELGRLRSEGNDALQVINQSIMRGYQGIFPVRNEGGREWRTSRMVRGRNIRRADEELCEVSRRAQQTLQKVGEGLPKPTSRPGNGTRLLGSPQGSKPWSRSTLAARMLLKRLRFFPSLGISALPCPSTRAFFSVRQCWSTPKR